MIVVLGTGHCAEVTTAFLDWSDHEATRAYSEMDLEQLATLESPISVLWVCVETTDMDVLTKKLSHCAQFVIEGGMVILATPVPVGTCRRFQQMWPGGTWISAPENLRRGDDVAAMMKQTHTIGTADGLPDLYANELFNWQVICTDFESAEMKKLALNSYLLMQIEFANSVAALSAAVGAKYKDVEAGLRSDPRVGEYAYLKAGPADTTHFQRDMNWLVELAC